MKRQKTQKSPPPADGHWLKIKGGSMVRATIAGIMMLMALALSFLFLSPKPFFYAFIQSRNAGRIPDGFSPPEGFEKIEKRSIRYADNAYDSRYENSTYDLYLPMDIENPPIFIFFHGGGFIQGDKQMAVYYGPAVAAEGYAVISVNYILAPSVSFTTRQIRFWIFSGICLISPWSITSTSTISSFPAHLPADTWPPAPQPLSTTPVMPISGD